MVPVGFVAVLHNVGTSTQTFALQRNACGFRAQPRRVIGFQALALQPARPRLGIGAGPFTRSGFGGSFGAFARLLQFVQTIELGHACLRRRRGRLLRGPAFQCCGFGGALRGLMCEDLSMQGLIGLLAFAGLGMRGCISRRLLPQHCCGTLFFHQPQPGRR